MSRTRRTNPKSISTTREKYIKDCAFKREVSIRAFQFFFVTTPKSEFDAFKNAWKSYTRTWYAWQKNGYTGAEPTPPSLKRPELRTRLPVTDARFKDYLTQKENEDAQFWDSLSRDGNAYKVCKKYYRMEKFPRKSQRRKANQILARITQDPESWNDINVVKDDNKHTIVDYY
jgi:hypothetical protein